MRTLRKSLLCFCQTSDSNCRLTKWLTAWCMWPTAILDVCSQQVVGLWSVAPPPTRLFSLFCWASWPGIWSESSVPKLYCYVSLYGKPGSFIVGYTAYITPLIPSLNYRLIPDRSPLVSTHGAALNARAPAGRSSLAGQRGAVMRRNFLILCIYTYCIYTPLNK